MGQNCSEEMVGCESAEVNVKSKYFTVFCFIRYTIFKDHITLYDCIL